MYCIPVIDTKINKSSDIGKHVQGVYLNDVYSICVRGYNGGLNLKYHYGFCMYYRSQDTANYSKFNTDFPGKKMG